MALTSDGFRDAVFASLVESFPTIATLSRANPNRGISAHNPVRELMGVLTQSLITAMSSVLITGLQDPLVPAFTPPGLINSPFLASLSSIGDWPVGGSASTVSSLGWTGENALAWMRSVHEGIASYFASNLQVAAVPFTQPGIGFLIFTATAPAYGVATRTAAASGFLANGNFFTADTASQGVHPQLLDLAEALGNSVGTLLSSLSTRVESVGTPSPNPATLAATGTFV